MKASSKSRTLDWTTCRPGGLRQNRHLYQHLEMPLHAPVATAGFHWLAEQKNTSGGSDLSGLRNPAQAELERGAIPQDGGLHELDVRKALIRAEPVCHACGGPPHIAARRGLCRKRKRRIEHELE